MNNNLSGDFTKKISSPNKDISLFVCQKHGVLSYKVKFQNNLIINSSKLGFNLQDTPPLATDFIVEDSQTSTHQQEWVNDLGEQKININHYNQLQLNLKEVAQPFRHLVLHFRIFNDGIAFRYEFPFQDALKSFTITDELTEFNLPDQTEAWWIPAYQPDRYEYLYKKTNFHEIVGSAHTPLTLKTPDNIYMSIHEAKLNNYASMTLKNQDNVFKVDLTPLSDGRLVNALSPSKTPWRTIIVAKKAIDLTTSRITLNLNDASKINDTSWIKPIKFLGIWWGMMSGVYTWGTGSRHGATTERAKRYIDYCVQLGIKGLLIEGWNKGWDGNWLENGSLFNFSQSYPDFDLEAVAKYAQDNNIELIGHHETAGDIENYVKQWPEAFALYKKMGINYIKVGYANPKMNHQEFHHSQFGVRHYQKLVELSAENQIMLDIHEPIKGTGLERTWPNLMTREGARGQEYEGGGLDPSHTTIIPFTRCLAGAFDFTPGIFNIANYTKRVSTTLAKQLAFYVTIFSPMQMVADRPEMYMNNLAFDFIKNVPTVWQQSIPLGGEIGEFFVIARQDLNSQNWYIGGVTNEQARSFKIVFDFLDHNQKYQIKIFQDGANAHWRENPLALDIQTRQITANDTIDIKMADGGGFACQVEAIS